MISQYFYKSELQNYIIYRSQFCLLRDDIAALKIDSLRDTSDYKKGTTRRGGAYTDSFNGAHTHFNKPILKAFKRRNTFTGIHIYEKRKVNKDNSWERHKI